ncbi:hypothetical protein MTR67_013736 [Solanum verrucosum]|uniref:Uncharacterized protein n=1 Tax=Solanum verrucosum TaxID=315347 RepID=A0AAF0QGT1_SOLVR|nr:hypothetical protein MTR67_013736 [Solanum verrucosum]
MALKVVGLVIFHIETLKQRIITEKPTKVKMGRGKGNPTG